MTTVCHSCIHHLYILSLNMVNLETERGEFEDSGKWGLVSSHPFWCYLRVKYDVLMDSIRYVEFVYMG